MQNEIVWVQSSAAIPQMWYIILKPLKILCWRQLKCSEGTEQFFINEWCDAETEVNFTHILLQYAKEDITIFIYYISSRFNFDAISNID